jgi:undecaprenyl-diphosphatase
MIEAIHVIDKFILLQINSFHSAFLDVMMFYFSETWIFVPFIFYLFYYVYKKIGLKKTAVLVIFFSVLITICDQSANLTKHKVKRFRPTHNLEIKDNLHLVKNYRGGKYGFFSSHAANSFGIAMFFFLLFSKQTKAFRFVFFILAFLVSYSRMYMGVHYPSDIFVGLIVGVIFGFLMHKLLQFYFIKMHQEMISI